MAELISHDESNIPKLIQKAFQFHKTGDFEQAVIYYETVIPKIENKQTKASLHGNVGAILISQGEYQLAKSHLEAAVKEYPESSQANFNLAVLLSSKLGKHGLAIR